VVISEERGEISLCVKGKMAPDLERAELRAALQKLFDAGSSTVVADEARAAANIAQAMAALASDADKSGGTSKSGPTTGQQRQVRTTNPGMASVEGTQ
jgi:hypothetical protein